MSTHRSGAIASSLLLALLALGSCGTRPTPEMAAAASGPAPPPIGDEAEFLRLAGEIHGFGGFVLEADTLVLLLVDPEGGAAAEERVREVVREWRPETVVALVRIERASFGYAQLRDIYRRLVAEGVAGAPGVVAGGVDVRGNQVRVQVSTEDGVETVERILLRARVPREAVRIEVTGPIVF
jgi:hypothetical protein